MTVDNPFFIPKDEEEYANDFFNRISNYFHVKREVWGTHWSGKKVRIDGLIKPKDNSGWKNKNIIFGVEVKYPSQLDSYGDFSQYISQAIDYSQTTWGDRGYLSILLKPPVYDTFTKRHDRFLETSRVSFWLEGFLNSLLCKFNIGEINENKYYGLEFKRGNSPIWREHNYEQNKKNLVCQLGRDSFINTKFGRK